MTRLTLVCPEALMDSANALARILGFGADDERTFGPAIWRNDRDERFSLASLESDTFLDAVAAPLLLPKWGGDLKKAEHARSLLQVVFDSKANLKLEGLTVIADLPPLAAIALAGLAPDPEPPTSEVSPD